MHNHAHCTFCRFKFHSLKYGTWALAWDTKVMLKGCAKDITSSSRENFTLYSHLQVVYNIIVALGILDARVHAALLDSLRHQICKLAPEINAGATKWLLAVDDLIQWTAKEEIQ